MHYTKIDLPEEKRKSLCELLNTRLADILDLSSQAKQAHWNVKGPSFIALHELFDDVAESLDELADMIAERVTALGGTAEGTVSVVLERSQLPSYPLDIASGRDHVHAFSTSLAAFGKLVREAIEQANDLDDAGTEDLFTEVSRAVDKHLWFVEAHVQAES